MTTASIDSVARDRELVLTRVFDAPAALVFKFWTDPSHLMRWWGPRVHPVAHIEMDVRPGGQWRGCLRSIDGREELWQRGTFREVEPPHRLAFTFAWEEAGERGLETLVTVTFAEEGGKTRMTLRQTPFQSLAERDGHDAGWSSCFDRLEDYLVEKRARA